eukprot:gene12921-13084_t
MQLSRMACVLAVVCVAQYAAAAKPLKVSSDKVQAKLQKQQVELRGGMFTFGTLDGDIEGFQEAAAKGKDENQRIDDMKDSIGGETFDMINEQL